jgi:hypothetical protein
MNAFSEHELHRQQTNGDGSPPTRPSEALRYATELGWTVFPVPPGTKKSHKAKKHSNGVNWGATSDPEQVKRDFQKWPNANVGIPAGIKNGFFVVDADTVAGHGVDGVANFQALIDANSPLPETRTARTATGGIHKYLKYPNGVKIINSDSRLVPGVDVRGEGGMVLAPPSIKPGVGAYEWISEADIAEAPQWLIDKLKRLAEKETAPGVDPQADLDRIAKAMEAMPNIYRGHKDWKDMGIRLFAAGAPFEVFDKWSQKCPEKYNADDTRQAWREITNSPPNRTGAGAIFKMADELVPGWRGKAASIGDFIAYLPAHNYIYIPTREPWPASSVNSQIAKMPLRDHDGEPMLDDKGNEKFISASTWLDQNRAVQQMTWAPGEPLEIRDKLIAEGGWFTHKGATCLNLYRPPTIVPGDASKATIWIDHVHRVYPEDGDRLIDYSAHLVQFPQIKINHAILMGGDQGIGKDTILEPVKQAIGPWNFQETTPRGMSSSFNSYLKAVALRINEAHDLGETNRFAFYEQLKTICAAPPDVHRINQKHINEHYILNCNGTFLTTNHKTDGIYLPPDDRRTDVMWSDCKKEDFDEAYWNGIWNWYEAGGYRDVAAYLATKDISAFNPKKPPKQTEAFWAIVNSNMAPEHGELADVLDALNNPPAVTLKIIIDKAGHLNELTTWLEDKKNGRIIPHRMEAIGYVSVRNPDRKNDGLWSINKKRQAIYAKRELPIRDQIVAARTLIKALMEFTPAEVELFNRMKRDAGAGLSKDPDDNVQQFKKR